MDLLNHQIVRILVWFCEIGLPSLILFFVFFFFKIPVCFSFSVFLFIFPDGVRKICKEINNSKMQRYTLTK